jgi:hypothetical protein
MGRLRKQDHGIDTVLQSGLMVRIKSWCGSFRLIIFSRLFLLEPATTTIKKIPTIAAKKPKHFDVGTRVAKKAGGGMRIRMTVKTVGPKTCKVKFFESKAIDTLKTAKLLHPKEPPTQRRR